MRNNTDVLAVAESNKSHGSSLDRNTAMPGAVPAYEDHEHSAGYDPYDHTPAALSGRSTANSVVNIRVVSTSAK